MYRERMFRLYWKLEKLIAPGLRSSQDAYAELMNRNVTSETIWLDGGCGHSILSDWHFGLEKALVERCTSVSGLDPCAKSIAKHRTISDVIEGSLEEIPFPDCSFDLVSANMVVEHLENPQQCFKEIHRVLKPGGRFVFHTTNKYGYYAIATALCPDWMKNSVVWLLQDRDEEDIFPTVYRANSEKDIRALSESSGFLVQSLELLASSAQTVIIPPLVIFELIWIRLTMLPSMASARQVILATLEKPAQDKPLETLRACH